MRFSGRHCGCAAAGSRLARLVNDTRRQGWEVQIYEAVDLQTPEEKFVVKRYGGHEVSGDAQDRACYNAKRAYDVGNLLDPPGIAATIDLVEDRFLVTEWIEGPRLKQVMRAGKYRSGMARAWILALGEALAALTDGLEIKKAGFGHGDVQPSNVMLQPDSGKTCLKLIDLDYVGRRVHRDKPVSASALAWSEGRRVMKPPEYALGTETFLDTCSDCFSFGLVAFWLLCRMPAFKKKTGRVSREGPGAGQGQVSKRGDGVSSRGLGDAKGPPWQSVDAHDRLQPGRPVCLCCRRARVVEAGISGALVSSQGI